MCININNTSLIDSYEEAKAHLSMITTPNTSETIPKKCTDVPILNKCKTLNSKCSENTNGTNFLDNAKEGTMNNFIVCHLF